jgi:DNA-binding XRE family transcriptional regulator
MSVLERLFPRRRRDPKQVLSDDLVNQTQDLMVELIAARKGRSMTQQDVADIIGVTRTAVTHFERYDADPKLSTIIRYAMAVDARIDISVSDGRRWAERVIEQERVSEVFPLGHTGEDNSRLLAFRAALAVEDQELHSV